MKSVNATMPWNAFLELISQTAQTVLEFMQHSSSQRVEWYVVILIVVEILLSLYDIIFKR
ncbi:MULTISPECIES: hypothetical protein [Nostoc]|uniref:hypothetical protein n=1 Tax=Nostoc TaxID=1177 RepID=UPI001F55A3A4|nr:MULTISPECIES: hypothetical protein [Nostoc]